MSAEVSNAAEAGCGEEIARKLKPVGPLSVCGMNIVGECIRSVVALAVEVVVLPAFTQFAGSKVPGLHAPGVVPSEKVVAIERGPVRAALGRPDAVPLPATERAASTLC